MAMTAKKSAQSAPTVHVVRVVKAGRAGDTKLLKYRTKQSASAAFERRAKALQRKRDLVKP